MYSTFLFLICLSYWKMFLDKVRYTPVLSDYMTAVSIQEGKRTAWNKQADKRINIDKYKGR